MIYLKKRACRTLKTLIIKPRTFSTSKTEFFVTIVYWQKLLTISSNIFILDIVAVLHPRLQSTSSSGRDSQVLSYLKIFPFLSFSGNLVLNFLRNIECDFISFSSLVKNSFVILGSLMEIEYFVLDEDNLLYLNLASENWVEYLWVVFPKTLLNIFDV